MMTGYLTQGQLHDLLQQIVDAGFYEWEEEYLCSAAPPDFDYLVVNLASHSRQPRQVRVDCADVADAPERFSDLKQFLLASPASATNVETYAPDSAYLEAQAVPPEWRGCSNQWPEAGYALSQATGGMHIEGETLAAAWEVINEFPCSPACMQSDEGAFSLKLVIPGVSLRSEGLHPAFTLGAPLCR